ncbi:hypothetical protein EGR_07098 [Echinococcus granulosus]|uniref:Uncharacterized protein n=1 Tax=Echinococcus granulosus TaxID=6210 RepID=W6U9M7_ECHGR|nr:hypothetical protein EGR_07098 [Echinococcus granulosus]EUB58078.1 hypothetical protein EGR_07098 [Echinococcus granulosus]
MFVCALSVNTGRAVAGYLWLAFICRKVHLGLYTDLNALRLLLLSNTAWVLLKQKIIRLRGISESSEATPLRTGNGRPGPPRPGADSSSVGRSHFESRKCRMCNVHVAPCSMKVARDPKSSSGLIATAFNQFALWAPNTA